VIGRIFDDARLSDAKQRAIREQHYSRTVKVFLQTRTRFWLKDNWSGFAETDLRIERSRPIPASIRDRAVRWLRIPSERTRPLSRK
jgi:monoamine oxidase